MPIALAGLDGEVAAIALLFALLVGVLILRPLLVALFSNAPLIGPWLASNVDSGLAAFERAMQAPARAALGSLSASIDWLTSQWTQLTATLSGFASLAATAVTKITTLAIPAAEERVIGYADAQLAAAASNLRADVMAAEKLAAAEVAAVQAQAVNLFHQAQADALALVAQSEALAQALAQVAEAQATAQIQGERAFVVDQLLGVQAEIEAAVTRVAAAAAAADAALQGDLGSIEAQLKGQIQTEVDSLLRLIEADKAALAAALTGSLAGVIADVAAIKALECLKYCSSLAQVGAFLEGLDAMLLVAFVAYARQHPSEAVGFMVREIRPLLVGAVADARALIGG